jgi:hypothetical protein
VRVVGICVVLCNSKKNNSKSYSHLLYESIQNYKIVFNYTINNELESMNFLIKSNLGKLEINK